MLQALGIAGSQVGQMELPVGSNRGPMDLHVSAETRLPAREISPCSGRLNMHSPLQIVAGALLEIAMTSTRHTPFAAIRATTRTSLLVCTAAATLALGACAVPVTRTTRVYEDPAMVAVAPVAQYGTVRRIEVIETAQQPSGGGTAQKLGRTGFDAVGRQHGPDQIAVSAVEFRDVGNADAVSQGVGRKRVAVGVRGHAGRERVHVRGAGISSAESR